jgi:hypothetical protein
MTTKLILIEGIPGSGKSTFARKIADWYRNHGTNVNLYTEGQSHPADLAWNACVPMAEYGGILRRYEQLSGEIERRTVFEGDTAVVAYTLVKTDNRDFYKELEAFEVYNGRVPDERFFKLHYDRWRAFGQDAMGKESLNIFECAFLQNHVEELLFWRNAGEDAVIEHHNRLIDSVKQLSPALIYLSQPDIRATIERVARERVFPEGGSWLDLCVAYCENSPFGKQRRLKGFDGTIELFTIRKQLEMKILGQLSIPHIVAENVNFDWNGVWAEIEAYLANVVW